jgi:hypothetical protein
MRIYAPRGDALTGKWNPPAVTKVQPVRPQRNSAAAAAAPIR